MEVKNILLKDEKGENVNVSLDLSDKSQAAKYFGIWYKSKIKDSDVVSWCQERIAIYERFIENLKVLMQKCQFSMFDNMDANELRAILEDKLAKERENANGVAQEADAPQEAEV
jgi:hypothetical protein